MWKKPLSKPDLSSFILKRYGTTFGSRGLGQNTYIRNNFYGRHESSLLTNVLLYHLGTRILRRQWNSDDDRRWRATTKSPYFANKVPGWFEKMFYVQITQKVFISGSNKILPAAAVIGKVFLIASSNILFN